MQYYHLFSDEDGESRWRNVLISFADREIAPGAQPISVSNREPAKATLFLRLKSGWNEPIRPTERRQLLVALTGRVIVTANDGQTREIGPGDVWRIGDRSGNAHQIHVISDVDFEALMVQID